MNIFDVQKSCVGCSGCIDICPVGALEISKDVHGFYIPKLKENFCVSCGKCIEVCPAINKRSGDRDSKYYYGWSTDEAIRASSSSGGAFRAISDYILHQDGIVFGARYSDDCYSVIMDSTKNVSIETLQRSKYVQADATGLYSHIKESLKQGEKVLLTGTPCQIATARKQFGNDKNLVLIDFLCGGVPSPDCYTQYIQWLEKKYKSKVVSVNFRDKKTGWGTHAIRVCFENGKVYFSKFDYDPYFTAFLSSLTKRKACIDCEFTTHRVSDITIADFWGYKAAQVSNDKKGISLIVAHTSKGKDIINDIENFHIHTLDEKYGNYGFFPRTNIEEKQQNQETFMREFEKFGFEKAMYKSFYKNGKTGVLIRKVKKRIKSFLRILK